MNKREELERRLKNIESLITESKDLAKSYKQEKKQLKKQLNDLPSLEVGRWYKNGYPHLFFCQYINGDVAKGYGFKRGKWEQNKSWCIHNGSQKPATDKEVETALIAEAKKRGFKEGVKFKGVEGAQSNEEIQIGEKRPIKFGFANSVLGLYCENSWIFRKGKWAEIIKPKIVHIPEGDYTETQVKDILNNKFNK